MSARYSSAMLAAFVMVLAVSGSVGCAVDGDFYADVIIDVMDNGDVAISGISNHPALRERVTPEFTSKDKDVWLLNMTLDGVFSEYVYEVRFPRNAVINYLRVPNRLSVEEDGGRIVVTGTGSDEMFYVVAQYSLGRSESSWDGDYLFVMILALALVVFLLYFLKKTAFLVSMEDKKGITGGRSLSDRQSEIVDIVAKNGGSMTQAELQKRMGIPKASLSRNIDALVLKNILLKESKGMTNVVSLKKN